MDLKGIIASDIDHTLTDDTHFIPMEVEDYLSELVQAGWGLILLTGRTLSFAKLAIGNFEVPYTLGVQNGAEVFDMPDLDRIMYRGVGKDVLETMEELCKDLDSECIAYSGSEGGDFCYYRPHRFSGEMVGYLEQLKVISMGEWHPFEDLSEVNQATFPLVKFIGKREIVMKLDHEIQKRYEVNTSIIQDVIYPSLALLMITNKSVSKGVTLHEICKLKGWSEIPKIGVGDDGNDISLLRMSNVGISMGRKCDKLVDVATIVSDKPSPEGLIESIEEGIRRLKL